MIQRARFLGQKLQRFRRDENGQVLLFTALIVLVLVCLIAAVVNVGMMISWKIRTQNAVDAAALGAGIWQARGHNLMQSLNQIHYWMNNLLGLIIIAMAIACYASCAFIFNPCFLCSPLGSVAAALVEFQKVVADVIEQIQDILPDVMPILSLISAQTLAYQNGLDNSVLFAITDTVPYVADYFAPSWLGDLDGYIPDAGSLPDAVTDIPIRVWGFTTDPAEYLNPMEIYGMDVEKTDEDYKYPYFLFMGEGAISAFFMMGWGQGKYWLDATFHQEEGAGERPAITFMGGKIKTDAFLGGLLDWGGRLKGDTGQGGDFVLPPMLTMCTVQTKGSDMDPGGRYIGGTVPNYSQTDFDSRLKEVHLPGSIDAENLGILH